MAVTLVAVRKPLTGVAGTTNFWDVPEIQIVQAEDILVYEQDTTDDSIRNSGNPLTLNTHYTITITNPNDLPSLFKITLDPTSYPTNLPADTKFIVVRATEITQDESFSAGDPFPESVVELVLDKATLIAQEAGDLLGRPQESRNPRAIVANRADNEAVLDMELPDKATRAGNFLSFDSDGNPVATAGSTPGTVVVSSFWEAILDETTKLASLTELGITFSTASPVAAGDFTGELWYETDRRVTWQWDGSVWEEIAYKLVADTAANRPVAAADFGYGFYYETDTRSIHYSNATAWVELFPDRAAANANFLLGADATGLLLEFKDVQTLEVALPRGWLEDLTMSVGTDTAYDTDIGVGECRSNAGTYNIIVASDISKQLDVNWAAGGTPGTPAGGIASSLGGVASGTWYHVFVLGNPTTGAVDGGYDTSLTAVNLLADATGFTEYRRIGSVLTDGGATIIGYTQQGHEFLWDAPVADVATTLVNTAQTPTMSVPTGVKIHHLGDWSICETGALGGAERVLSVLVTALDQNDVAPASPLTNYSIGCTNGSHTFDNSGSRILTRTNLSSSVRWRGSETTAAISVACLTHGWIDTRGRT